MAKVCEASEHCLLIMCRPNEVLIGVQNEDEYVHYVSGSAEQGIDSAWRILDAARRSMEKGGREIPVALISAMKLIEPWLDESDVVHHAPGTLS